MISNDVVKNVLDNIKTFIIYKRIKCRHCGSRWYDTYLPYLYVRYVLWRYGDAECHGRKDKPHCRVNGIIGQAAST